MGKNFSDMIRQLVRDGRVWTINFLKMGRPPELLALISHLSNDFRRVHSNHAMDEMLRYEMMRRIPFNPEWINGCGIPLPGLEPFPL
jgi:hypothetical protein